MKLNVAFLRRKCAPRFAKAGRVVASCAVSAALLTQGFPVVAQTMAPFRVVTEGSVPSSTNGQLLLEADQLVYDFDKETVTALGNVQIYYNGFALDAEKVVYNQKSGRLIASGGIRMIEPSGNFITSDTLDITDDFRDGFIGSLNVITTDRTRFTAQTGERRDGKLTIFRKGVYTACQPCVDHPERPPLWRIRAARIIHNETDHTIYYEHARLEFLGIPIAYAPIFFHPDPTVKRKTGFLVPSVVQGDALGFGVTTPFFWNLAPNYDVTFSPTVLSRQGLLMQGQWRHRMLRGSYSIRAAGIFQRDPDAFKESGQPLSGDRDFRGSIRTRGSFGIADHWNLGWDVSTTTDRTFNRDYSIPDAQGLELPSTLYLTGMNEQNYFNAAGYYFRVQREDTKETVNGTTYLHDDQAEQALVHPVVDSNYIVGMPVLDGEMRFDSNIASLTRDKSDIRHPPLPFSPYYAGVAGSFTRATSRSSWKRRFIIAGGHVVTPFTYLQADADWTYSTDPSAGLIGDGLTGRVMPAVGVQYEYPVLATLGSSVHTFGPKAQLIVRPNETRAGALPNEDSQSLEFDDTSLFKWDKFAGYDRIEGGTRANLGLVYQGLYPNGMSVDAIVGQSIQLAGVNSFALQDHAVTGVGSGLESDSSDYLARVTLNTGLGIAVTARGRFDDKNLKLNRSEVSAVGAYGRSSASLDYVYLRESPASGIFNNRTELSAAAAIGITDNWSFLGSLVYDLRNGSRVSDSLGVAYADDCFSLSATYTEVTDLYSDLVSDRRIFFRVSLRTVGGGDYGQRLGTDTDVQ